MKYLKEYNEHIIYYKADQMDGLIECLLMLKNKYKF
jgi:hypothetical protein